MRPAVPYLHMLKHQPTCERGRQSRCGSTPLSFKIRTWLDMNMLWQRRDHVVLWCNVYMLDACEPSGPAVSKLAIWPLPLYCLNESIWSEGVENVVPCGLLLLQVLYLIRQVLPFDRSWYVAICDDLPRIGTIDNATPAGEIFFFAWALIPLKTVRFFNRNCQFSRHLALAVTSTIRDSATRGNWHLLQIEFDKLANIWNPTNMWLLFIYSVFFKN